MTTETVVTTTADQSQTVAPPSTETVAPPAQTGLEFIPEAFRSASWASKYKTPEEFFKGVDHMAKTVGQKQVVSGIQVPGADATPDEWNAFYAAAGRPESADKYAFPEDAKAFEGFDIDGAKKTIAEMSHGLGLNQKQVEGLFKGYLEHVNNDFKTSQEATKLSYDKAVIEAFGNDFKENLGLAKKGAISLGIVDKLDSEGLSANPLVLKLCAELGKFVGEDSFEKGDKASGETILQEAQRIQRTPEYINGDPVLHKKVAEMYQKVYPPKKG